MLGVHERVSMGSNSGKILPVCVDARLVCISVCDSSVKKNIYIYIYFFFSINIYIYLYTISFLFVLIFLEAIKNLRGCRN